MIRHALFAFAAVALLTGAAFAQVSPEEARQKMAERVAARKAAATQPTKLTNEQVEAMYKKIEELQDEVKALKTELRTSYAEYAELKARTIPKPPDETPPTKREIEFKVGSIGVLPGEIHVVQVVDARNMIGGLEYTVEVAGGGPGAVVIRHGQFPPNRRLDRETKPVWFTNFDTKGVTDGAFINRNGVVFEVVGTKTYETTTGATNTTFVIQPWTPKATSQPTEDHG